MNIRRYVELKNKGKVSIVQIGNVKNLVAKKYDEETSEELPDEVVAVDIQKMKDQINDAREYLEALEAMGKDFGVVGKEKIGEQ